MFIASNLYLRVIFIYLGAECEPLEIEDKIHDNNLFDRGRGNEQFHFDHGNLTEFSLVNNSDLAYAHDEKMRELANFSKQSNRNGKSENHGCIRNVGKIIGPFFLFAYNIITVPASCIIQEFYFCNFFSDINSHAQQYLRLYDEVTTFSACF